MNFENNKEAVPSGIVVKKEMETNETAGIKIICFTIYNSFFRNFIMQLIGNIFSEYFDPPGNLEKEEVRMEQAAGI